MFITTVALVAFDCFRVVGSVRSLGKRNDFGPQVNEWVDEGMNYTVVSNNRAELGTIDGGMASQGFNPLNPFRTAVPFWGQTSQILSSLSPKWDCGSKAAAPFGDKPLKS